MMNPSIKKIAYYLPEQILTNQDLHNENPTWDLKLMDERVGKMKRHIAHENETALDLALSACHILFESIVDAGSQLDAVIFCTQSPDYLLPSNACLLHKMLDLPEDVMALDINLACSGFVYGLALARGLIVSGFAKNILLVNADTYSKYISKTDRATRMLFGDGAAATWIEATDNAEGILDIQCATSGQGYDKFIVPAGGCRLPKSAETALPQQDDRGNILTQENIHMDGMSILVFVNTRVLKQIQIVLARNNLTADDIDLFVFHQASKLALDSLSSLLGLKPGKAFCNLQDRGNTVSASIPIALKDAIDSGRIERGNKVLVSGFGAGLSWGTAIIEI